MDEELMVGNNMFLYGFVGDSFMESGFSAGAVAKALASTTGDIVVRLNSGGGYATEGAAIYSALRAHQGKVTVRIEGVAASAASLIAMAGDEIVVTEGALLMIHDPRNLSIGTAKQHRKAAADLEKMAAVYAGVYSSRSSQPLESVRAMMDEETWFSAEEAVAAGFATQLELDDEEEYKAVAAFDFSVYSHAPEQLRLKAQEMGWSKGQPKASENNPAPQRAAAPTITETVMTVKPNAAAPTDPAITASTAPTPPVAPAADPAPAPQMQADPFDARRSAVTMRFGDKLTARQVEDIAKSAKDVPDALMNAANILIDAQLEAAGPETREPARILSDEGERQTNAMIDALGVTMFGGRLEGPATEYRGLTMKKLAMHLAGKKGFSHSDADLVKEGMSVRGTLMAASHSTSDFGFITSEIMNRQLRAAYNSRPGTWGQISRVRSASDFRTLYSVRSGMDTEMRKVKEDGEYQATVIGDEGESFRVERYGRKILLTFEAVINDDLGAFARIPGDFARGARNLESRIAWGLINANGNMADGVAFFAAARNNLADANSAISATAIAEARKAMMEQRPFGSDPEGDDFVEANPNLLFVPPALEIQALQFTAATVPVTDGTTNPYKGTLTPVVEPRLGSASTGGADDVWYLFDSSLPPMEHAYLQGYEAPLVETMERMDPDGVTMIARHIFGAGLVEPLGSWKNPTA